MTNFAKYLGGKNYKKNTHTHTHTHTHTTLITWTHLMSFVNFEFQRVIKREEGGIKLEDTLCIRLSITSISLPNVFA
jgi:hypothetical protein